MIEGRDTLQIFAVAAPGLEELLTRELHGLGLNATAIPGGAEWEGSLTDVHRANLHSRLATRVLVRVAEFRARTFFELERHAGKVPWDRFLNREQPLHLRVSCKKSKLYHEGAVAERLRRAAEQRVGPLATAEVSTDEDEIGGTTQLVVVRFLHDRCTMSADTSGEALYRRGYRQALARAPLRETLAAALLHASGWHESQSLLDPMCGSGTIPIEAALLARNIAPGIANAQLIPRAYAFQSWPDHDAVMWEGAVEQARSGIREVRTVAIQASDRDAGAVQAATANAQRAGVLDALTIQQSSLSSVSPPAEPGWLLTNPPYGLRVSERSELRNLYAAIGRLARESLSDWNIGILAADDRLAAQLGIRFREAFHTRNGGIPVRFLTGEVSA
ncbi:RNA methyltransferase [soil metagenome]